MSKIDGNKCDNCGKTTLDRYEEIGWIELRATGSSVKVSRSMGRDSSGVAVTDFIDGCSDFCNLDCLRKKLDAAYEAREAKKREPKR